MLYYATYREVITTVNGEAPEDGGRTYEIREEPPIVFSTMTTMCSMPYNFLYALLQESTNPEWVMAVVDLLLEKSEIVLMIQDQLNVTTFTSTEVRYHAQKTVTDTYQAATINRRKTRSSSTEEYQQISIIGITQVQKKTTYIQQENQK